ncbi:MAG: class I SAM-dependent methyltransferase [Leptolyngbyaceae cyanobacterium CSU_1_4]|nr:class I SAM-dependent methyltransferase [Leptolyngbyaceae cyanobacterium CSU_1_4]
MVNEIDSVLECGSGLSTVFLEVMKRETLLSKSLTLEHSVQWWTHVKSVLAKHQLGDESIALCPLAGNWFDLNPLKPQHKGFYDLILIDSPPSRTSPEGRYPALAKLKDFIRSGTWIILDDFNREHEQNIVQSWLREYPIALIEKVSIDTGLAVMRWI